LQIILNQARCWNTRWSR